MAVETDVVVGRKIDIGTVADHRLGAGDSLVHPEKRIGDVEKLRCLADHLDFAKPFEFRGVQPAAGAMPLPLERPR